MLASVDDCRWPLPPPRLSLGEDEVHLWRLFLAQVPLQPGILSDDEQERAVRYRLERVRQRFTAGRRALRRLLSRYLGLTPGALRFRYGEQGKPALGGSLSGHPLRFNVSHSENLMLLAVTREREIGVDVEYVHPIPERDTIAAHYFSPAEHAVFRALPAAMQTEAFFNCWTRKEAYLKALGGGLSVPLTGFDVSLVPGQPAQFLRIGDEMDPAARWALHDLRPAEGYIGALAVEELPGHPARLRCWHWSG